MKQKVIKPIFLLMISWVTCGIVLLGYNPVSIAWYGAANMVPGMGIATIPVIIAGLYYYQGLFAAVKYAMIMVSIGTCTKIYRKCSVETSPFVLAGITLFSTMLMEFADWGMKNQSTTRLFVFVPIGMLVWSATVIFSYAVRAFMGGGQACVFNRKERGNDKKRENGLVLENSFTNADTILKTANAFKQIAIKMHGMNSEADISEGYQQNFVEQHIDECVCQGCANSEIQYLERARLNCLWYNKMVETREAMAVQFSETAKIVEAFLNPNVNVNFVNRRQVEALQRIFREKKVLIRKVCISENAKGRYEVRFQAKKKKRSKTTIKQMEEAVGKYVGRKMRAVYLDYGMIPLEYTQFEFLEEVNFHTLHGTARRIKNNENISGDNFTYVNMENGQTLMSVCDGMGSGERANEYSNLMIDLLEQLLESGLNENTALRLVNSVLMTKSGWDVPTTLDMGLIDLYSGSCRFLKSGAACTYIKRGNWVECIRSTSLPIGVLNEVDVETITKKLYDGDFIIMISDGIVDSLQCADKEKAMARVIMDIDTNNPKEMALTILNQSLELTEGIPKDDMTVLVTGIWRKAG